MFNAFFDVDGEVKTLNQLGISNKLAFQFLKLGTQDLEKVDAICTKYNMAIPTEMKLYYDIVSGKYDKNTMFSLMIKKLMLQWHSSKGIRGKISFISSCIIK